MKKREIEQRVIDDCLEWMAKAKWHVENPTASKAMPSTWDNSAQHTSNMLHVCMRRLERGIMGEQPND